MLFISTSVFMIELWCSCRSCHAPLALMAPVQPLTPGPSMTTCSRPSSRSPRTRCMETEQQGLTLRTFVSQIVIAEYCKMFKVTTSVKTEKLKRIHSIRHVLEFFVSNTQSLQLLRTSIKYIIYSIYTFGK